MTFSDGTFSAEKKKHFAQPNWQHISSKFPIVNRSYKCVARTYFVLSRPSGPEKYFDNYFFKRMRLKFSDRTQGSYPDPKTTFYLDL